MPKRQDLIAGFFSLMTLSLCFFSVGQAQAASGNGPYYAEPAWDQKLPAATRFVVLTDWASAAVLDRETGLVWEQSPATSTRSWTTARFQCANRVTGNRKGWRLPSIHELQSLIDPSMVAPSGQALPAGHPFTNVLPLIGYWSATPDADNPSVAWSMGFISGGVTTDLKSNSFLVWCVRGGNSADAY